MSLISQSGTPVGDAIVAIYIGADGTILASEKLTEPRTIGENQLGGRAPSSDAPEIIACEVSASVKVRDASCGSTLRYSLVRVCYDKFGNRVPCF